MDPLILPQPDTISVNWGWFQFLLLLTFPLHLLAMNAMLGGLAIGIESASHRGALASTGQTIAVIGGGLKCICPREM